MRCDRIDLGGGAVGIICSRGARRKTCSACKRNRATKLCDFPLAGSKAGKTCDRDLCDACATTTREPGATDTTDLCPAHAMGQAAEVTIGKPPTALVTVPATRRPSTSQASLDFTPPTRKDPTNT